MEICGKSYLFLNCHLTSGQEKAEARAHDFQKILSEIRLPYNYNDPTKQLVDRFDYVFIMGDLNFRINKLTEINIMDLMGK